jgi:peptidoglycan/LPS O-acetylase OafA/YrhL
MFYYEVLLVSAAACSIRERVRPNKIAVAACLVYALLFPLLSKRIEIFLPTYPVLALAVAYIAVCAGHGFRFLSRTSVTSSALHWMGERSYVIYVLHFQVLAFAGLAMQMGGLNFRSPTAFAVGLTVAVLAAIPLYEFVHKTVEASGIRIGRELSGSLQSLSAGYEAKRWPLGKDSAVPHGKG